MESQEFIKVALHKKRLKSVIKVLTIEELTKLANDISDILEQRQQEIAEMAAEEEAKKARIEELLNQMQEDNLSIEDLLGNSAAASVIPAAKKSTHTVAPKYRIIDSNGEEHLWTGHGRAPKVFQNHFDQGNSKESCLIAS